MGRKPANFVFLGSSFDIVRWMESSSNKKKALWCTCHLQHGNHSFLWASMGGASMVGVKMSRLKKFWGTLPFSTLLLIISWFEQTFSPLFTYNELDLKRDYPFSLSLLINSFIWMPINRLVIRSSAGSLPNVFPFNNHDFEMACLGLINIPVKWLCSWAGMRWHHLQKNRSMEDPAGAHNDVMQSKVLNWYSRDTPAVMRQFTVPHCVL